MRARLCALLALLVLVILVGGTGSAYADKWLGGGVHYLRNLGDITDDGALDLSQNSFSLLASAKNDLGLVMMDGQLEYVFNYVGTDHPMWQPSLWLLLGRVVYGGAGIGIGYSDGEWQSNPFYALRAGVAIPFDTVELDLYASYRFQSSSEIKHLTGEDLNSLTFAGVVRFGL